MNLRSKAMRGGGGGGPARWLLVLATLAAGARGAALCERGRGWWDRARGACVPCARCDPALRLAVRLPCELHRDTVCQSLDDVNLWPFEAQTGAVNGDYEVYDVEYDSEEDSARLDLQTSTLSLAATGCVIFFVVVLCMSFYHAKQWRLLKQALKSDVDDLSAKLKLMETGAATPAQHIIPADHHVYCNVHVPKETRHPVNGKKGLGNVYTQEKH